MTGKSPRPGQSLSHRHSVRLRFPPNLTFRSEKAVELAQGHELPARIPRINLRPAATCRKSTIALIGSVFFPYYAWARRRGDSDPLNHAAPNVALYGETGKLWSMTERGRYALRRGASWLEIGRSALSWDGNNLTIRIDEVAVPFPTRIRGTVRLYPEAVAGRPYRLDAAGKHHWASIAPRGATPAARRGGSFRRYRAGAAGRFFAPDRRSSLSTGQSSPQFVPRRTEP